MKLDIIFAGVGGQGIVSIASMLAFAASEKGFAVKQNEVHGMAQRGGSVACHVRISDKSVWAGIIPKGSADFILSIEPMEGLRYAGYLSPSGIIISGNQPVKNIDYPDENRVISAIKKHEGSVVIDTAALADKLKNTKAANIILLGALIKKIGLFGPEMESLIKKRFASKGESVVDINLKAFNAGMSNI
ncbi:MAG: indolepyruvate oxidoreductase subunit beta [Deltaproteobacteria bacterium]|nr:indolepyruvate oxidoreductase subunit beta [Deltaproteobacteria bacterium]MBI2341606.1 indolepyruvate oxidoreductase subunit beta [Deltaproteobacteria bacterium]